MKPGAHLSTRQYARLVDKWVALVGLDPAAYGTHSMRRTKVSLQKDRQPSRLPAAGGERNRVHLVTGEGVESWEDAPKSEVAHRLAERIADALA